MKKVLCLKRILPVFLFAIIFCSPLYAVTVVIQPGPAEGKDTHVKSISPTINFETYPYFYSEDKTTHIMQALVQLNLPSITAKQINSATLKLYCFDGDANTVNVYANRITSSWSESGATWNNRPTFTTDDQAVQSVSAGGGWFSWDVTDIVNDWLKDVSPEPNYGFVMVAQNDPASQKNYYTSDYTDDTQLRPKLEINYNAVPEPISCVLLLLGLIRLSFHKFKQ